MLVQSEKLEKLMSQRTPGYYWAAWTERADKEVASRRPGPFVAHWDGAVWWFILSDVYRFDCELEVLGNILAPPRSEFSRAVPARLRGAEA